MWTSDGRLPPAMPVGAYKTYNIATPLSTHWSAVSCKDAGCEHYENGWALHAEALTERDVHLARTSGRRYREHDMGPGQTWLVFEAGQPCFAAGTHVRRLERPEVFATRGGDWRGDPTGRGSQVLSSQSWLDDCGENQENLAALIERG